jgi:hypothetical protein
MPNHQIGFDLISDLYVDNWAEDINWTAEPTSVMAVVAGDVSSDLDRTVYELKRISECYKQVIYIDGDLEHQSQLESVPSNRSYLNRKIERMKNCIYLYESVLLLNNTAFVGANLWWSPGNTKTNINDEEWVDEMRLLSLHHADLEYLRNTVRRLQVTPNVNNIVIISHTVPNRELLVEPYRENLATDASDWIEMEDFDHKIKAWCFGHGTRPVKFKMHRCEYVSNPKGLPSSWCGLQYHPQRVTI